MAKQKKKDHRQYVAELLDFNIPKGITIYPIAIADIGMIGTAVEQEFRDNEKPIDPPTYEVPIADSEEVQILEHEVDEKAGVSTLETDDDKIAWAQYLDATTALQTEIARRTMSYIVSESISIDWDCFEGWEEKRTKYGIQIPKDEDEKKAYFLESLIWKTPQEQKTFVMYVMRISAEGSDQERVKAMEEFFRGSLVEGQDE